ncbi:MAG: hypothetical protein ACUVYA_04380 [Planctomycetota bacterium]
MVRNALPSGLGIAVAGVLAAASFALAASGCYSNPHGYQDTPPILRLVSVPSGATVDIPSMNLRLETPCDLPTELDLDDEISVSKRGYVPFRGTLGEIREISRRTFEVRLNPVSSNPQ